MTALNLDVYRIRTRLQALKSLYALPARDVEAFLDAYVLFDGDWRNQNGKREEHIVDYYRVLNQLCALGSVEKMYFPPLLDASAGVTGNQVLFERRMMQQIGARSGAAVLDIGCGRGRVACHVAAHSGAHVSGLNIDPSQLENARAFAASNGLADRCRFVRGSLNDPLPFPDESFDAGYEIQAFTYAKDKDEVFAEIFRVLRPGAKFSYLDWVVLPAYRPDDPVHADIMRRTRGVIGGVDAPTAEQVTGPLERAGFHVLSSGDASIGGHQSSLITGEDKYFNYLRKAIALAVQGRLLPRHFAVLFERLVKDADAFIAADQMGLATTSYQIVCEKPASA